MSSTKEDKDSNLVDRQKVTPFLLRIFLNQGRHFALTDYTNSKLPPKSSELQVYTWLDANLSELTGLIREIDKYQAKGLQFSYNVVYPDNHGQSFRTRSLGLSVVGKPSPDDEVTLAKCRYQIGDYLDVAILSPGVDASHINDNINKGSRYISSNNQSNSHNNSKNSSNNHNRNDRGRHR